MDDTMSTSSPWSLQTQDMLNNRVLKIEWNKAINATSCTPLDECMFSIYNAHNDLLAIIKEKFDSTVSYEPDIRLRQVEYVVSTPDGVPMFKIVKVPSKKYWDFAVYTMDGKMVGNVVKKVSIISSAYKLYTANGKNQRTQFCAFSIDMSKLRFTLRNMKGKPSGVLDLFTGFTSHKLSESKEKFIIALDKDYIEVNGLLKNSKILEFSELPHSFERMAVVIAGVVSHQFNVIAEKINVTTTHLDKQHSSILHNHHCGLALNHQNLDRHALARHALDRHDLDNHALGLVALNHHHNHNITPYGLTSVNIPSHNHFSQDPPSYEYSMLNASHDNPGGVSWIVNNMTD
ncbi:hypothetical protein AX774_g4528 [Zancudomyces culisetae]|uniref:Phospholipid scramblase n=1 Tax=Zancudomyces culisetae TaxID=1213189 RepID=A0A1R1PM09_ZANCU|nr:hypothetical protein AX774_g4528 [Zancudomyces culisetae]|eukprot:OMH82008.1 hypothetical protein AX774_g4528 [Zancudomyces culisetae]